MPQFLNDQVKITTAVIFLCDIIDKSSITALKVAGLIYKQLIFLSFLIYRSGFLLEKICATITVTVDDLLYYVFVVSYPFNKIDFNNER